MLTPQEVAEHAFAKASFGGYNMAMVDEFLDLLTADYTALYKENAALKAKMKVLADKVEEYRATDDAMRKALLSAQKYADQVVAEAEGKKAELVADAEREAVERRAQIQRDLESEELRLAAAKNATTAYVAKLKELYQHEMDYLNSLAQLTAQPKREDVVAQMADATAAAVEKVLEEEMPAQEEAPAPAGEPGSLYDSLKKEEAAAEEPAQAPADEAPADEAPAAEEGKGAEESAEPTRRIDFSDLKFGKDYRIE